MHDHKAGVYSFLSFSLFGRLAQCLASTTCRPVRLGKGRLTELGLSVGVNISCYSFGDIARPPPAHLCLLISFSLFGSRSDLVEACSSVCVRYDEKSIFASAALSSPLEKGRCSKYPSWHPTEHSWHSLLIHCFIFFHQQYLLGIVCRPE